MEQPTFADLEYEGKKRKTRREIFLERMEDLVPWGKLEERIRPYWAGRGRRPYELSVMLRIHCGSCSTKRSAWRTSLRSFRRSEAVRPLA